MADIGSMNVKVGADISDLLSKVDAAKAKLNQLTESQQQYKEGIKDLTTSLRLNETELTKANAKLQSLNTSSKEGKAAAEQLRKEISQLALNSRELTSSLTTAKTEYAATTAQIKTQTTAVSQLEKGTGGFAGGLQTAYSGLRKLAYIIPGLGIAGLIDLISGPVIAAFEDWYTSINKVSEAQLLLKANQKNLNDVIAAGDKDAGKQVADLKILYQAATDVNLSMKDRLAAVKGLQKEFPDYFGNIKTENILNGNSKQAYDDLTQSIIANARAKAAKAKIDELEAQKLDKEYKIQKILNAITNEANAAKDRTLTSSGGTSSFGTGTGGDVTITRLEQLETIGKRGKAAIDDVTASIKSLGAQEDFLIKQIGLSKLASQVETTKPGKIKTEKGEDPFEIDLKKLEDNYRQAQAITINTTHNALLNQLEDTANFLAAKQKLLEKYGRAQGENNKAIAENDLKIFKDGYTKIEEFINGKPKITLFPGLITNNPIQDFKFNLPDISKEAKEKINPLDSSTFRTLSKNAKTGFDNILKEEEAFGRAFQDIMQNAVGSAAEDLGSAIGEALSGGIDNGLSGLFNSFFETISTSLEQLGKLLIKTGIEMEIAKKAVAKLFANPYAAIAAGIGLVALGVLLKSQISQQAPGFATGGYIRGPGGPKSDSIPAWLSNGEYVLQQSAVSKLGIPFLNMLNAGVRPPNYDDYMKGRGFPRFSGGGLVSVPNLNNNTPNVSVNSTTLPVYVYGNFELRNDKLVAAVKQGNARIGRNS